MIASMLAVALQPPAPAGGSTIVLSGRRTTAEYGARRRGGCSAERDVGTRRSRLKSIALLRDLYGVGDPRDRGAGTDRRS